MSEPRPTIEVDDVHIHYEVYEDAATGLKQLVTDGRLRRRMRRIHAVRGVSFSVYEGETVGLIGSNGSGKSTLMSAMTGLLPITSGDIRVRERPALLGVSAALRASLSGRRNIMIGCLALGMAPDDIESRTDEIIDFAGLSEFIDLPMRTYSSGMRARLNFSIATAATPSILLIDEALAVGDQAFRERSQQRIDEIRERAGSVVLVSHNLHEIARSCDRTVWVEKGELRMVGDSAEVVDAYVEAQAPPPTEPVELALTVPRVPVAPRSERRAVLHLGVAGAGDDIVQSTLHRERAAIFRQGVIYPSFISGQDHRAFARYGSPIVDGPNALDPDRWEAWTPEFADRFLAATDRDGDLVLSSVTLGYLDSDAVDRVTDLLRRGGFTDVDAVLFVRRQDELASIVHRRQTLRGGSEPFDLGGHLEDTGRYDFARQADAWAAVIGDGRVHVRLHADRDELASNLSRFVELAGLAPFDHDPPDPVNHPAALEVVRELNRRRGGEEITPSLDFLLHRLEHGEPHGLESADAMKLLDRFRDTNRSVLARVPDAERIDDYFDAPRNVTADERDFDRDQALDLLELVIDHMGVLSRTLSRQQKEV